MNEFGQSYSIALFYERTVDGEQMFHASGSPYIVEAFGKKKWDPFFFRAYKVDVLTGIASIQMRNHMVHLFLESIRYNDSKMQKTILSHLKPLHIHVQHYYLREGIPAVLEYDEDTDSISLQGAAKYAEMDISECLSMLPDFIFSDAGQSVLSRITLQQFRTLMALKQIYNANSKFMSQIFEIEDDQTFLGCEIKEIARKQLGHLCISDTVIKKDQSISYLI